MRAKNRYFLDMQVISSFLTIAKTVTRRAEDGRQKKILEVGK
ncbi:hypothetical protein N836_11480 [Leptolyngbya sp. Heron Island J]|nr:hypothetical protein N836_11480 [Leptolyngbya sp. Heron Island J]